MLPQLTVYAKIIYLLMVVISGGFCTVEDYVIMSQCAHNKAIHLSAEGAVSVTDISQTQNITILGLPDFVNNAFKIALYAKETQRYLCFSENWRLVALKELQNTCYFNETIVHGYFVFRSVLDLQRRVGFTHRGKAVGPKKNVNDACYLFTKIQANEFFHQHNNYFAHKTTTAAGAAPTKATGALLASSTVTTTIAKGVPLPSSPSEVQRNKNRRRNNSKKSNYRNINQNVHRLNGHNSNISSNLSSNSNSNKQQQRAQQPQQAEQNEKLVLEKGKTHNKSRKHHHDHHHHHHHHSQDHDRQQQHQHQNHHRHLQKQHSVRHHHNNPDIIARRQQHVQKQKRRPNNRLHMPRMASTSTSTSTSTSKDNATYRSETPKTTTSFPMTLSKWNQAAFSTLTLAVTPSQKLLSTSITPKVTSDERKLLTTILMPTISSSLSSLLSSSSPNLPSSSTSLSSSSPSSSTSLSSSSSSSSPSSSPPLSTPSSSSSKYRTSKTPSTSKRKGLRRNYKKHTFKQQKLTKQQPQLLKPTVQATDDQPIFITDENGKPFSLSTLASTTWSDLTSIASFLDESKLYYGNEWPSTATATAISSQPSDENFAVSPTAMQLLSETSTSRKATDFENESTSFYSARFPFNGSTNAAYTTTTTTTTTTTNSIKNRKKSTTSSSTSLSTLKDEDDGVELNENEEQEEEGGGNKELFPDEIESSINEMISLPGPTDALPKMKATTKVNLKTQHDKAATTLPSKSKSATNTSSNKTVSYVKSHVEPDALNVTSMGETSTATTPIRNVISKDAAKSFTASTTTQQQQEQQLHGVTPTLMSDAVINVNYKKWLMNVKANQSNENININNNKNILRNSMTELINSTRSSNSCSSEENGTSIKYQNGSLQQYQTKAQLTTDRNVELNVNKTPIWTLSNSNSLTTLMPTTKLTIFKAQEVTSTTTLSPLLQLFSPYYVTESNNFIEMEKNTNNGNINDIIENKTPETTTESNAQNQFINAIATTNSFASTSTTTSSVVPSVRKAIRKSTQKLLATPFHQITTYVRNEAGDIDIDNIDNISVYPDVLESETDFTDDAVQLKKHQHVSNNNKNNTNSRLIVVSGYLPTSASAVLPESIQIAKIKINNERQRLWPQRFVGNTA